MPAQGRTDGDRDTRTANPLNAAGAIGGKTVYRVRMGPYATASELAEAKRKLAAGGLPAMAIKVK